MSRKDRNRREFWAQVSWFSLAFNPQSITLLYSFLFSEAEKQELVNAAQGAATAVIAAGKARAESIQMVAKSLEKENGHNAAALAVAEKYVAAFEKLARTNNTLILPSNTGDVSNMVAQVWTIDQ